MVTVTVGGVGEAPPPEPQPAVPPSVARLATSVIRAIAIPDMPPPRLVARRRTVGASLPTSRPRRGPPMPGLASRRGRVVPGPLAQRTPATNRLAQGTPVPGIGRRDQPAGSAGGQDQ